MLVFGPPDMGKTRLVLTAPRPLLVAIEPGLMSLRGSDIPTVFLTTPAEIDEFFRWVFSSTEAAAYDTLFIDSISEMTSLYIREELSRTSKSGAKVNGEAAYGEMATRILNHIFGLYYVRNKHVVLTAKQTVENGTGKRIPSFEGRKLTTEIPHRYDLVAHLDLATVPGVARQVKALRTRPTYDILARDRSGKLAEFEQPDLNLLFNKLLQG
jgi:hypothetical protein